MSKITLEPNSSGAGTFSIVSPDSNTNRTLNLPDESGVLFSNGSGVPGSAVTGQLASSNMPAGSVIQVVSNLFSTETQLTSTSYVDVGLSASITPIVASSKVHIICNLNGRLRQDSTDFETFSIRIVRDGVEVHSNVHRNITAGTGNNGLIIMNGNTTLSYLDSPNSTSSVEYKLQAKVSDSENGQYSFNFGGGAATLTLMEIAG